MHVIIRSAAQYQLVHLFEYRTIFEAANLEICVTVSGQKNSIKFVFYIAVQNLKPKINYYY